jgi:hypothetical protein
VVAEDPKGYYQVHQGLVQDDLGEEDVIHLGSTGIGGRYKLTKLSAGGIVLGEWEFDNLITDYGMDNFANYHSDARNWTDYVILGGGSRDPDVTNPNIDAFLASREDSSKTQWIDTPENDYRVVQRVRYSFPPGTLNNVNITEIGISHTNNGTGLNSHAKIEDDNGNPTTITVLTGESLMVEYRLYTTIQVNDVAGSFELDNEGSIVTINTTSRQVAIDFLSSNDTFFVRGYFERGIDLFASKNLFLFNNNPPRMTDLTALQPATSRTGEFIKGGASSYVRDAYIPGSFERTGHAIWDASVGPKTWHLMVATTMWGHRQILFDPPIEKVIGKSLRMEFRTSWARV